MADETAQDPQGQSTTTQDPSGQGGESPKPEAQNPKIEDVDNLPEQFKGKTATEIAKSYVELQKLQGKHTKEVSEARDKLSQWEKLGEILEANPELYKQVESAIDNLGKTPNSDRDPKQDDTRVALENTIISKFEEDFGIQHLSGEKRGELHKKIGAELADMLDPGGKKSVRLVLDDIPVARLRQYLEKAYRLATNDDREEQARLKVLIETKQNSQASFGTFPSTSIGQKTGQLTEEERKVAQKMGIPEEKYLKNKLAIANE